MILLPQSIMDIVSAGGGITINLKKQILLPQVMMDIAAIAARSGAKVTFKTDGAILLPQTMIEVAAVGRGNVVFDFS